MMMMQSGHSDNNSGLHNSGVLGTLPGLSMMSNSTNPLMLLPLPSVVANVAQDKINRELFVGNTPPGTSELLILHFVNAAMRRVGLCHPNETPVLNSRVNNKFAFIELSTPEMATRALNLNGIPFLTAYLKISRPSKYTGPIVPSQTWQQLTGQSVAGVTDMMMILDPEQEKIKRELFIGNTTPEMTESMLREFLGNAIQQVGLTSAPGNPITACRVSGKFAFIELRTPEEAAAALNLNNIPYLGTALRVGRPSKYNGPTDHHGNWEDILAKYMSGELQLPNQVSMDPNTSISNPGASTDHTTDSTFARTRVVELQHMLTLEDLTNDDEYNDVLDDTRAECSQFGHLLQVVIPRHDEVGATKVFLEYATADDAANAISKLQGRTFDGRLVQATYLDEEKFAKKDYS